MTKFIAGGDRSRLRLILWKNGQSIDETLLADAKERPELVLMTDWLTDHGIDWRDIEQFGVIVLPHSHTSVRVIKTLISAAAWFNGKSFLEIPTAELADLSADQIFVRISGAR